MNLELFMNKAPDAFLILDANLTITYANDATANMSKQGKNALLNTPITSIIELDEITTQDLKETLESGIPIFRDEIKLTNTNKNSYCSIKAFKLDDNNLGIILIDNTELRYVINEVREFNQFLQKVISNAGVSLQVLNINKEIMLWNKASELLTGYTQDEILSASDAWSKLIPNDKQRNSLLNKIEQVIQTSTSMRGEEITIQTKNNSKKTLHIDCQQLVDDLNQPIGAIALEQDITMRKHLEEQLLQSQKMEAVGTLAGGVAHDFNNLLTVILGDADLILDTINPENSIYDLVKDIGSTARRAGELTRQLLLFSRNQTNIAKNLSLNHTANGLLKMLKRLLGENVHIELNLDPELWLINADEGHIEQTILNLCINARDAMPKGGNLLIATKNIILTDQDCAIHPKAKPGRYICLKVKDNGIGIDGKTIKRIFDPFFTTKKRGSGTGLGLAVVYGVINDMEGWLSVRSKVGIGTEFTVHLPAVFATKPDPKATRTLIQSAKQHIGNGELILLIEDEPTLCRSLARALKKNGYEVVTANDSDEGQHQFHQYNNDLDLIISDVILPGLSGVQLANEFSKTNPEIKILLMTGYLDRQEQADDIKTKSYPLLQKPFSLATFLKKVKAILNE